MAPIRIVALHGDQTGQELLEQALRVLDPEVLGLEVELTRFDLSLANRRRTRNEVCIRAAETMRETGLGLKAATITPPAADDVGSPNRILREAVRGKVILRTGRRIPGVTPVGGVHHPIAVCRMAVGERTGPRSRASAPGATSSPTAPRPSAGRTAAQSPSMRFGPRDGSAAAYMADRSGPSARSTRGC